MFANGSPADLVARYARPLPLAVICELLGLPAADRPRFMAWAGNLTDVRGTLGFVWRMTRGVWSIKRYLERHLEEARASGGEGLIAELVRVEREGARISRDEMVAMVFLLLFAGHETTTHLISGSVYELLKNPALRDWLKDDWSRANLAVEEFLRFISPVQFSKPRFVRKDVDVCGVHLKRGDRIMVMLAAANFDPEANDHPDKLDLARRPNRHIAFGSGIHFCLGHQLARIEARSALQALFSRWPAILRTFAGAGSRWWRTLSPEARSGRPLIWLASRGHPRHLSRMDKGQTIPHRFCVAPMMEWTDRHCRYFLRLISRRTFLYTEMVTAEAVIHGDRARLLGFDPAEHPVGLQLGGCDPGRLAEAARIGAGLGYDEINLNVGCPSDRVQSGRFGACLMAEPSLVARCVAAMREAAGLPVTLKCRIGIDDQDAEESLDRFIDEVAEAGCRTFIVHARKAWLKGLSPKENRDVPPLDHGRVYRLKARKPDLEIVINGGIGSVCEAKAHLGHVDGAMLGRAAYADPYLLAEVDRELFGADDPAPSRADVLDRFVPYVARHLARGARLNQMTRHILGLFHGEPRARAFRRHLAENAHRDGAGLDVLQAARRIVVRESRSAVAAE